MSVDLDLTRLREAYSGGMLPSDIVVEVYSRLAAAADPGIFISVVPMDAALSAARALPPFDPTAYPLWGVPFAVKDNIDVAGMPTTAGVRTSPILPRRRDLRRRG